MAQVVAMVGVSQRTIERMERAGNFPKRRRIAGQMIGWLESEVAQWLAERPTAAA